MAGKSGIVQIRNKFLIFFADNVGCGRRERSGSIQYIMLGDFIVFFPGGQGNALSEPYRTGCEREVSR